MITETTMKAIKKSKAFAILTSPRYKKGENKWCSKRLRDICKLDKMGYPISKIYDDYNGSKIKIAVVCRTVDERVNLTKTVCEIFDNMHLEIRFMSNGTYIK